MASRARSWWKLKTSASVSTSRPPSTARRRWSIRSASDAPVTEASRSNGTRRPSTDAATTTLRTSGSSPSTWLCTTSATVHGRGASSKASPPRSLALATSSSRKNGLPPVRVWSASTARNDGSCSNTAVEERAHVGRAEPGELEVRHRVAPVEPRQQVGGGVLSREAVGAIGADHHQWSALRLGEELEGGQALRVGPVQVFEHDERGAIGGEGPDEVDAGPHPLLGRSARVLDHGCALGVAAHVGAAEDIEEQLHRSTDGARIGLAGQHERADGSAGDELLHEPRLADPGLAGDQCDHRYRRGPLQGTQPPQLGRATDHDR